MKMTRLENLRKEDKNEWYSARRRKLIVINSFIIFPSYIRMNDTPQGDGNH